MEKNSIKSINQRFSYPERICYTLSMEITIERVMELYQGQSDFVWVVSIKIVLNCVKVKIQSQI